MEKPGKEAFGLRNYIEVHHRPFRETIHADSAM
jgi:hypothetical protein